jgi:cbb3-type cytochrome oxidase maturation protein
MDILYLLVPLSAVLVLAIIGVFAWALHRGQFDDLDREAVRILDEDGGGAGTVDPDQAVLQAHAEQSPAVTHRSE